MKTGVHHFFNYLILLDTAPAFAGVTRWYDGSDVLSTFHSFIIINITLMVIVFVVTFKKWYELLNIRTDVIDQQGKSVRHNAR